MNVAERAPVGMVTVPGTATMPGALEVRATVVPVASAGPFNVSVPVIDAPPRADAGDALKLKRLAGFTVSVALLVLAPMLPVSVIDFPIASIVGVMVSVGA